MFPATVECVQLMPVCLFCVTSVLYQQQQMWSSAVGGNADC